MTTILSVRQALKPPLRADEVAELHALTARLPQLVKGWSAPLPVDAARHLDVALRLDAAMWEVARRHGIDVRPGDTVFDVVDRLSANGWSHGPARDALRAFVMLRWSPVGSGGGLREAARVIAYLELRARYG
jgi:hypothetical protein